MEPNIALVNTPAATEFILGTRRPTQVKAWLGDPSNPSFELDGDIRNEITAAHTALAKGAETITALTGDMTRSEPEKHAVGAEVSARTVAALETAKDALVRNANAYEAAGKEALASAFALKPDDRFIHEQWLGFVHREAANADGGYGNISAALAKHRDLANVIMKLPPELLNVAPTQLDRWRVAAITKWEPSAQASLQMAEDIRDVADRYVRVIGMVKTNFANPAIAAKVATRVRLS